MHEIHLSTIDSTHAFAKSHVATFPSMEITCVTADAQTAGRGRHRRKWISPAGVNLYATFCFRLPPTQIHLHCLAHLMTYCLAQVLLKEGLDPKIKWPNDVLLGQKKMAGVLCETEFHPSFTQVFLSIGINVNLTDVSAIEQPATSLKIETGGDWDRQELLKKLQWQLSSDLERFKEKGFAPFRSLFEQRLAYRGKMIRVSDGKKEWVGICHSLTEDGKLVLCLPDQTFHTIVSADVLPFRD